MSSDVIAPLDRIEQRPIDIERVVTGLSPDDTDRLRALAQLAHEGFGTFMEEELRHVCTRPHEAARIMTRTDDLAFRARNAALAVHRSGMFQHILSPTEEALTTLRRDSAYLELARASYSNDRDAFRRLQFHIIGRLARMAAGR